MFFQIKKDDIYTNLCWCNVVKVNLGKKKSI